MEQKQKKLDELRQHEFDSSELVTEEAVIDKALRGFALMPLEHAYLDSMYDNESRIKSLHDILIYDENKCTNMNELLHGLLRLREMAEIPDDDLAYEMRDKGLFCFDEEDEYMSSLGAGELFRLECVSANEALMKELSDICRGWCVHGVKKKG